MLYTLNLDDNNAIENIVTKGLVCIDKGLKENTNEFSSYKKALVNEGIFNKEDATLFVENIKDLKEKDNLLIKADDKFFLAELKEKARVSNSLVFIEILGFEFTNISEELKKCFDDGSTIKEINSELSDKIKYSFDELKDKNQEIKYEIIKAKNSLMKIEKENDINGEVLKKIKEGSQGELIIELDPPEYKDESLPTIYQSEESLEQMYLTLFKNQIDFCLKLQEMTTKELVKTQELFNKFFRKSAGKK
jgi:hypothetical protein